MCQLLSALTVRTLRSCLIASLASAHQPAAVRRRAIFRRSQRPSLRLLAHRAWNPPPSSSLAKGRTPRLLLLRAAARDFPTLAAAPFAAARASRLESAAVVVAREGKDASLAPPPCGGARFSDARSRYLACASAVGR